MHTILLGILWLSLWGIVDRCVAEENPNINAVLKRMSEQYQSGRFVWDVHQTIWHQKDDFRDAIERLTEDARRAPDGALKNNLQVSKEHFVSLGGRPIEDHILFTASFLNDGRFHVTQQFVTTDKSGEEVQYIADGDGLSYTVREKLKQVTIGDSPADVMRLLLRCRVDLFLLNKLPLSERPTIEVSGDQSILSIGNGKEYDLVISFDSKSRRLRSVSEKSNGVVMCRYLCSEEVYPGTALPATVIYEEFRKGNPSMKQIWQLKGADIPLDPTTVVTEYRLKPKYTIIDITNKGMRQFKSEDWLPKKSK